MTFLKILSQVPPENYSSALVTALKTLADNMLIDLRITKKLLMDDAVNCFVIAFEVPDLGCSDYLEIALPALCHAAEHLSVKGNIFNSNSLSLRLALCVSNKQRHLVQHYAI